MNSSVVQVMGLLVFGATLVGQSALAWPSPYNPYIEKSVSTILESPVIKIVEQKDGVPSQLEILATVKQHKKRPVRSNRFYSTRYTNAPVQMTVETKPMYWVMLKTPWGGSLNVGSGEMVVENSKYIYRFHPDPSTIGGSLGAPMLPTYDFELGTLIEREGELFLDLSELPVNGSGLFECKYSHTIVGKTEAFRRFFTGWKFQSEDMKCEMSETAFTGWFRANFCPAHKYCKI